MHANPLQDGVSAGRMLEWGPKKKQCLQTKRDDHFCGKMGHIAPECPKRKGADKEDQLHTNIQKVQEEEYDEVNINQGKIKQLCTEKRERGVVNKIWILLDSPKQSIDQIVNPALLMLKTLGSPTAR